MSNLAHRQQKIQDKRKQTPWREFVMEIASWYTINLNKNNGFVSRYPDTHRLGEIISTKEYEGLGDQMSEKEYNTTRSFAENMSQLRCDFKHPNTLLFLANENVGYADVVFGVKNAYLSFTLGANSENILYSTIVYTNCRNIINSISVTNNSENVFYSKQIINSYNVFYSRYIYNSSDIRFSSNLVGCVHCLSCDNLVNKSYCINNKQYTKEEYMLNKKHILENKHQFSELFSKVNNIATNYQSSDCFGTGLVMCSDIQNGHYVSNALHARNVIFLNGINQAENCIDSFEVGINAKHFYGSSNAGKGEHLYCCTQIEECSHVFYCYHMENCSFCLGCIGLKNKSYCILNKQYTKEERYEKVDEIFAQMDKDGTLGQFFPASMNPFYFNDTAAYLIDPSFTKEEVTAKGYLRRDEPIKVDIPAGVQTVKTSELGQFEGRRAEQRYIDPEIMKKVILDEQGNAYRIIPMEYEFLMKYGLPLPRKHRLERMKENFRIN